MKFAIQSTSDAAWTTLPATVEHAAAAAVVPAVIAAAGAKAAERFFTFFTDTIRNKNTRAAYYRNACRFLESTKNPGVSCWADRASRRLDQYAIIATGLQT